MGEVVEILFRYDKVTTVSQKYTVLLTPWNILEFHHLKCVGNLTDGDIYIFFIIINFRDHKFEVVYTMLSDYKCN